MLLDRRARVPFNFGTLLSQGSPWWNSCNAFTLRDFFTSKSILFDDSIFHYALDVKEEVSISKGSRSSSKKSLTRIEKYVDEKFSGRRVVKFFECVVKLSNYSGVHLMEYRSSKEIVSNFQVLFLHCEVQKGFDQPREYVISYQFLILLIHEILRRVDYHNMKILCWQKCDMDFWLSFLFRFLFVWQMFYFLRWRSFSVCRSSTRKKRRIFTSAGTKQSA